MAAYDNDRLAARGPMIDTDRMRQPQVSDRWGINPRMSLWEGKTRVPGMRGTRSRWTKRTPSVRR